MEKMQTFQKLKLNKRTISKLESPAFIRILNFSETREDCGWTIKCTLPECGSVVAGCRTNQLASCAPCLPPTKDPAVSRPC